MMTLNWLREPLKRRQTSSALTEMPVLDIFNGDKHKCIHTFYQSAA